LRPGWNLLQPGGDTKRATGGAYAFSVLPGARDKVLVFFRGGGCSRAEQCDRGQPFCAPQIDFDAASAPREEGIFDHASADNPRHYPKARVVGLGDAQAHRNASLPLLSSSQWGFPDALRRHPGWERFPDKWVPADFYLTAGRVVPRLHLFQVNQLRTTR